MAPEEESWQMLQTQHSKKPPKAMKTPQFLLAAASKDIFPQRRFCDQSSFL
jgi:hypothetical protein